MKIIVLLSTFVILGGNVFAQTPTMHNLYWEAYKKETALSKKSEKEKLDYSLCQGNNYLTNTGFNELSKQLFAKVIAGADGLPKEGTATSLTIDDETSKLGGNVNFAPANSKKVLVNIGVAGATSNNQLNLFTENAYKKGFKVSGGINYKVHSSVFYEVDSCQKVVSARNLKFLLLFKKIYDYQGVNSKDLIKRIEKTRLSLSPQNPNLNVVDVKDLEAIGKKLAAQTDSLLFIATYIRKLPTTMEQKQTSKTGILKDSLAVDYIVYSKEEVDEILQKELGEFELKNAITSGYKMGWLNLNYSFANNSYNIFDTSVTRIFSEATKKEAYGTSVINFSYNRGRVSKKLMTYWFLGISYGNRYALEDLKLEADTLVGSPGVYVPELSIKALDVSRFAETYNKSYGYVFFQLGGFAFFGEKKIVGLEIYTAVRSKINAPELIDYRPAYTLRMGPLFSMTKEKGVVSNGTLGLMLQSNEFTPSRKNFGDQFSFAVRLSVPFSNVKYL